MPRSPALLAPASALLAIALGCAGSAAGPDGPGTDSVIGTFSAIIDGQPWSSDASRIVVSGTPGRPGSQDMQGSQVSGSAYTNLSLTLGYIADPGTYPLGVNPGTTPGGTGLVLDQSLAAWSTPLTGAQGTVTVTSLTSTRMVGTFQFNTSLFLGTSAVTTRSVTSGVFDLPLAASFVVPPAADRGSTISAVIGGASWNGATVSAQGTGNTFSLAAITTAYTVALTTQTAVGGGNTYPFSSIRLTVHVTGILQAWGGTPGDVGTVTLTSLGAGRAVGMFSGTLAPVPGTAAVGTLTVTNGTFDVRVDPP